MKKIFTIIMVFLMGNLIYGKDNPDSTKNKPKIIKKNVISIPSVKDKNEKIDKNINIRVYVTLDVNGNAILIDRYIPEFNKLVKAFNKFKGAKILIEAYSGNFGTEEYRTKDEEKRAKAVKKFIIKKYSLKENDVITEHKGLSNPILKNNSDEAKVVNRRVEVKLRFSE